MESGLYLRIAIEEFESHAPAWPDIPDERRNSIFIVFQYEKNVHLCQGFQFQPEFCQDVAASLADVSNGSAKK